VAAAQHIYETARKHSDLTRFSFNGL